MFDSFLTELCLTSNVKCGTVKSYEDHHFKDWRNHDHPVVICVSLNKLARQCAMTLARQFEQVCYVHLSSGQGHVLPLYDLTMLNSAGSSVQHKITLR